MKRRKLKGLTLIELIVAMAVFSIIMVGVMNMSRPVQEGATEAKVANYQKTAEEAVVNYIGEQLRYANNIMIIEDGAQYYLEADETESYPSKKKYVKDLANNNYNFGVETIDTPQKAAKAFLSGMGIKNSYSNASSPEVLKPSGTACGQYYHMIIWDGKNEYATSINNAKYTGRMFAAYNAIAAEVKIGEGDNSVWKCTSTADLMKSKAFYPVYGANYFDNINLYLKIQIEEQETTNIMGENEMHAFLNLTCDSDYFTYAGRNVAYNSNSKKWKSEYGNTSENNPTVGTFQLRNYDQDRNHIKFIVKRKHEHEGLKTTRTSVGTSSSGKDDDTTGIIYILYTTDQDMEYILGTHDNEDTSRTAMSWGYGQSGYISSPKYYYPSKASYAYVEGKAWAGYNASDADARPNVNWIPYKSMHSSFVAEGSGDKVNYYSGIKEYTPPSDGGT